MREIYRGDSRSKHKEWKGFTIVELLIVVVVIAILAAITIVSYNGITASAKESTLKSDLSTAAKKLNVEKIESGGFPSSTPGYISGNLSYSGGGNAFCVSGTANNKSFRVTEGGSVEGGECALPVATTMQTFTAAHCAVQPTYTGSNPAAVINLTDSRGGTTRTYEVAKLADGKCWMLTNLKLGSTTGTTTLTPADSNVASSFTLPQLTTTGTPNYDLPRAYGPVPGDTGAGATNYGYLYNWSSATAGESRSTMPAGSGDTAHSICSSGWRLPTGGDPYESSANNEFNELNARMAGFSSGQDENYLEDIHGHYSNWGVNGPFKGVLSGMWSEIFNMQGNSGDFWLGSAHSYVTDYGDSAGYIDAYGGMSRPDGNGHSGARIYGHAIRCILN